MTNKKNRLMLAGVFLLVLAGLALTFKNEVRSIRDSSRVDWVLETDSITLAEIINHGGPTAIVTIGSPAANVASLYEGKATVIAEQKLQEISRNDVCTYLQRFNSVVIYAAAAGKAKSARSHSEYYSVVCSRPVYFYSVP
jgi:hypothetical protein